MMDSLSQGIRKLLHFPAALAILCLSEVTGEGVKLHRDPSFFQV